MNTYLVACARFADAVYTGVVPDGSRIYDIDLTPLGYQATASKGRWWHEPTGVAALTHCLGEQTLLTFGGTTAGPSVAENSLERAWENRRAGLTQWMSNLRSGMGAVTENLQLALDTADFVSERLGQLPHLVGHSKGAAEASYVALMRAGSATVFSSPGLSDGVIQTLPKAPDQSQIEHWFVKGDAVVELCAKLPWMNQIGHQHPFECDADLNGLQCHIRFASALESHLRARTPCESRIDEKK